MSTTTEATDQQLREAALDPTQSFIVQAPAGSGKTALLTQRFLKLLSVAHKAPEECLAITFTRKAASEMRERILSALERARNPDPPSEPYEHKTWELARAVLARDEEQGWELLAQPNRLKIQTIDSLCASITSQMPIVSRFGFNPTITEEPEMYYTLAARNVLKALEEETIYRIKAQTLFIHLDNDWTKAERLLADLLASRDQWLPYLSRTRTAEKPRDLLEKGLQFIIADHLITLASTIPPQFDELLALVKLPKPGSTMADLPIWLQLADILLREDNEWRKTVTHKQGFPAPSSTKDKTEKALYQSLKADMTAWLEVLQDYPSFKEQLQAIRECPPATYSDKQWDVIESLVDLLPLLMAELFLVFQQAGVVDFTEVTLSALRALGESGDPSELALVLDYQIHHILVDEFQDTSLAQFRLLEALTREWQPEEGRTLFLVGDPMQSIYRFRQAEVGLFIRAGLQGIGTIPLKPLTLSSNFRSDPKIIDWVNTVFENQFPAQNNMNTGAIVFKKSQAIRLGSSFAKAEIKAISSETESEPAHVVSFIQETQAENPSGSIALLVRARNHLSDILPALRKAGILYQGVELERLCTRVLVQDLLTLARALIHLGDRIAWLALFRTPWCALSLQDLWIIANQNPTLPIWLTLQSYTDCVGLSDSARERLATIVPVLASALSKIQRVPLRTCVHEAWIKLGGVDSVDSEAFFQILDEEGKRDFYAAHVLEERVGSFFADVAEENAVVEGVVQVMTIHKAKGLEFDTVIVPGVSKKTMPESKRLLLWEEGLTRNGNYLVLGSLHSTSDLAIAKHDKLYDYLRKQEAHRARYESVRLQYVAATRARERLYWLVAKD